MQDFERDLIRQGLLMAGELMLSQHVKRTLIELRRENRELRALADVVKEADRLGLLVSA